MKYILIALTLMTAGCLKVPVFYTLSSCDSQSCILLKHFDTLEDCITFAESLSMLEEQPPKAFLCQEGL